MPPVLKDYTIWLAPSSTTAVELSDVILSLSSLSLSPTDTPSFAPHVTLLSPIPRSDEISDIISKIKSVVVDQLLLLGDGTLKLTLNPPAKGTHYFQCVLSPVNDTPQDAASVTLRALRTALEEAFDVRPPRFFPHLSLLYGDLDEDGKDRIVSEATARARWPQQVVFDSIVLVDALGPADQWKVVGSVSLTTGDSLPV